MHNLDGPNTSANEIVNITTGEGELPGSFISETSWEALDLSRIFN